MDRISTKTVAIVLLVAAFWIFVMSGEDCDECFSPGVIALKVLAIGLIFIGGSFYYFYKWYVVDSILFKVERVPLVSVSMAGRDVPVAVYGEVQLDEKESMLVSPYTKTNCVFYHYIKEQYVSSGDSSYWKIIENKCDYVPFHLNDGSGIIHVNLRNIDSDLGKYKIDKKTNDGRFIDYSHSEIDALKTSFQRKIDSGKHKNWLGFNVSNGQQRVSEYVLTPNQNVFVYGWVHQEGRDKFISESKDTPLIVSRKTKEAYLEDFSVGDSFFYTHNLFLYAGVVAAYWAVNYFVNVNLIFLILALALVSVKMIVQVYNRMVHLRNRINNSRSQIDIELKKRYELIPLLNKIILSYSAYEKQIMKDIALMRVELFANAGGMDKYSQVERRLDNNLIMLAEKYPDLKASANFKNFMSRLSQIENNISYYRGFYSKTALKYNTLVGTFPFMIVAMTGGFKKVEYWNQTQN